jgi:hypothetical protein
MANAYAGRGSSTVCMRPLKRNHVDPASAKKRARSLFGSRSGRVVNTIAAIVHERSPDAMPRSAHGVQMKAV